MEKSRGESDYKVLTARIVVQRARFAYVLWMVALGMAALGKAHRRWRARDGRIGMPHWGWRARDGRIGDAHWG